MDVAIATLIAGLFGLYAGIGLAAGLFMVTFGAARIDPAARGMPLQARIILLPGCAALWPLMIWKVYKREAPPLQ